MRHRRKRSPRESNTGGQPGNAVAYHRAEGSFASKEDSSQLARAKTVTSIHRSTTNTQTRRIEPSVGKGSNETREEQRGLPQSAADRAAASPPWDRRLWIGGAGDSAAIAGRTGRRRERGGGEHGQGGEVLLLFLSCVARTLFHVDGRSGGRHVADNIGVLVPH
jgi:hypothetical protein